MKPYLINLALKNGKEFSCSIAWWKNFLERHNLKKVKARGIERQRATATVSERITPFYVVVETLFKVCLQSIDN